MLPQLFANLITCTYATFIVNYTARVETLLLTCGLDYSLCLLSTWLLSCKTENLLNQPVYGIAVCTTQYT